MATTGIHIQVQTVANMRVSGLSESLLINPFAWSLRYAGLFALLFSLKENWFWLDLDFATFMILGSIVWRGYLNLQLLLATSAFPDPAMPAASLDRIYRILRIEHATAWTAKLGILQPRSAYCLGTKLKAPSHSFDPPPLIWNTSQYGASKKLSRSVSNLYPSSKSFTRSPSRTRR